MRGRNLTLEVQKGVTHVRINANFERPKKPVLENDEDGHCVEAETVTGKGGVDSKTGRETDVLENPNSVGNSLDSFPSGNREPM